MALTPERINELKEQAVSAWRAAGFEPMQQVFVAHAIETEVRKSDEALILQLVEAQALVLLSGRLAAAGAVLHGTPTAWAGSIGVVQATRAARIFSS